LDCYLAAYLEAVGLVESPRMPSPNLMEELFFAQTSSVHLLPGADYCVICREQNLPESIIGGFLHVFSFVGHQQITNSSYQS
jgi:hypothetical protein